MAGNEMERIEHPVNETVRDVRCRVAISLGVPPRRIKLLHGTRDLTDDKYVGSLRQDVKDSADDSEIVLSVVNVAYNYQKHLLHYGRHFDCSGGKGAREVPTTSEGLARLGRVSFPKPTGININMMPFVIGDPASIPKEHRQYSSLLDRCRQERGQDIEYGKIGYLTIQEGIVPMGQSQRRPGLHTEAPGLVTMKGGRGTVETFWGKGSMRLHNLQGGIFMASTVWDSCKVWNAQISNPKEVVGRLGDIEHFREFLGEGYTMEANELFWITDTTPHESLPVGRDVYRQYFRFVTSGVSLWYKKHSTENPLGVVPDSRWTQIITEDKFELESTGCLYCKPSWIGWYCWYCAAAAEDDHDGSAKD
jgi:hypothetical protein